MKFYKIGSWILLLTGIGDIVCTDIFRDFILKIENCSIVFNSMKNTDVNFIGLHRSLFSIYNGFSLSTGVLLIFIGIFNILITKTISDLKAIRKFLIINFILLIYFLFVCIIYLPIHGVFIASIVLVLFVIAFFHLKEG